MKKMFLAACFPVLFLLFSFSAVLAGEEVQPIPEKVTIEHWSCREVAELGKKYDAKKKLPDAVVKEGKPCAKSEVAGCLLAIVEKVLEKCDKEGSDAVPKEDLDSIARLHEALKDELSGMEGYLTRREAIGRILAKPEEPPFLYKIGVNGFLRGEGAGAFRLPDFSFSRNYAEGRFLYRVKPYFYWHPADFLDIHLEGQCYGFAGGSQYYGKCSLYQGFIEGKLLEKSLLALKVGRQEFSYGSTFILGPNSFYDGLAFDAVRLRVQPATPLSIDLLGGYYASPFATALKGDLAGIYATYRFSEDDAIEAYGFRDTGSIVEQGGEHRDTWGLRGTYKAGPVTIEFEPVYQTGKVFNPSKGGNDRISAYGGHVDLTAETGLGGFNNKFVAGFAYGSGDKGAASGGGFGKEFRNPDNDTSLVGDMSVVGDLSGITAGTQHASGLQVYTLGWGISLSRELNFSATGHYFMANEVQNGFSRHLGLETDFSLTYLINDNLSIILAYDHFFTGGFFRDAAASKDDIHYGYVMVQFDLAKIGLRGKKG